MDDIGICQLCNQSNVPIRDASSQALNETTFLEIMVISFFIHFLVKSTIYSN